MIVVCGLLFSVFSFVYLYVFQREMLEALHYSLAHGKTHFAPAVSAIVITLILLLLRWGVNSLLGLKGYVRALSYVPSFLVLCALTDVGRDVYTSSYHSYWVWLFPLLVIVFIGVTYWLRGVFRIRLNQEDNTMGIVNGNLLQPAFVPDAHAGEGYLVLHMVVGLSVNPGVLLDTQRAVSQGVIAPRKCPPQVGGSLALPLEQVVQQGLTLLWLIHPGVICKRRMMHYHVPPVIYALGELGQDCMDGRIGVERRHFDSGFTAEKLLFYQRVLPYSAGHIVPA